MIISLNKNLYYLNKNIRKNVKPHIGNRSVLVFNMDMGAIFLFNLPCSLRAGPECYKVVNVHYEC